VITPSVTQNGTRPAWPLSSALPPLGALKTAAGSARAYVRDVLTGWQLAALADDAESVVGELVANAVVASTLPTGGLAYVNGRAAVIRVCLMSDGMQVVIEVHDEALGQPELRNVNAVSESGRGLHMVHALTSGRWGWELKQRQHGKVVWAALTREAM
jgi:Histidine kinase-like ATPase domain